MKNLLNLLIVFCFVTQVAAQTYTPNREKFVKELKSAISANATGDDNDFLKDELAPLLLPAGGFPDEYFAKMVMTCNALEAKKIKPYPEIYQYVYSVASIVFQKQSKESYNVWHAAIDKLIINKNNKRFSDFIDFSSTFFSKQIIASNSAFDWKYIGGTYAFEDGEKTGIRFSGGRLVCHVNNKNKEEVRKIPFIDSTVIYNASGLFDPALKKWEGRGGTVTWEKVGIDKKTTFAELKNVKMSLKSNQFSSDSVLLTTPYFSKKLLGILSDRAFNITRESDKDYPRFASNDKILEIKSIIPEVDYKGGFALEGASFIGLGTQEIPASVKIYRDGKPFCLAKSQMITVAPTKVSAVNCATAVYIGSKDSIYHQGLNFQYSTEKKLLELSRGTAGMSQAPFIDSYHQLEMYVPKITWENGSKQLLFTYDFGTSQEQRIAKFESRNFFDARLYERLQGLEKTHPLAALNAYTYKYDKYVLTEGEASTALNKTIDQTKPMFLELANLGFISYNTETKIIIINDKLDNFVKARGAKKDYDNLIFISDMRPKKINSYTEEEIKANPEYQLINEQSIKNNETRRLLKNYGSLSLSTLEFSIDGVDEIDISTAKATFVRPANGKVTVKENRNFEFKGWVNSGKMEVNTGDASFNYNENKIYLNKTENVRFRVAPKRSADGYKSIAMKSELKEVVGYILIDDPKNRAGINTKDVAFTKFPKLISTKPSKVYYNDRSIYRGAYDSTRFYFTADIFEIDSLDNFSDSSMRLKGELTSAGIFPKFRQDLKIMGDYSFGFSSKAPDAGYEFYGTTAKFNNKIVLSANGLQGAGKIDYLSATAVSKTLFTFLPDSTVGLAVFTNKAVTHGVEFPSMSTDAAYITYIPKRNVLKAKSLKDPIMCFNEKVKLTGLAYIEPKGARASGFVDFDKAVLGSQNFKFDYLDLRADTSNFSLKNVYSEEGEDPIAFKTDNVNSHVSFKDRKGIFKSNNGNSVVNFVTNQYICKMDFFTWYMDEESVEMYKSKDKDINMETDLDLLGANFFSTHPKQDSLQFMAPKALFSLKQKTIYCSKVPYIDIADARFFPDSSKVTIRKKARMDPLVNATMVANYITKYHKMTNVNAKIFARRVYEAEGDYPYYDRDSTLSYFHMDKIYLDTTYQTVARGNIKEQSKFKLSSHFEYNGDVSIKAASPTLTFNGATRLIHECDKFAKNWMAFSANIDPKNIQIPVSESMKTLDGKTITAGILWRDSPVNDSIRMYPTFLSSPANVLDPVVLTGSGFLQYNYDAKEFQIGSLEKLANRSVPGNFLALHTESCSMNGEGIINLGMDYGDLKVDAVGVVNYDQTSGKTAMNVTLYVKADLDKGSLEKAMDRALVLEGLKPMDFNGNTLEKAIATWVDVKTADKVKSDYVLNQELKRLPSEIENGFILTGVQLESYENPQIQNRGLISTGNEATLVNMYGKAFGKVLPVKVFMQQTCSLAGSDALGIYFSVPGGYDYYFDYTMAKKDGELKIISSDEALAAALTGIKEDKRKSKNFKYEFSNQRVFFSKFMRYFGGTE